MDASNYGSGSQHVNAGDGTQNVHAGQGNQYNAQNINSVRFPGNISATTSCGADVDFPATNNDQHEQNKRFLEDLMLSDPRFDKDRIIRTNGHLFKDSYVWVLKNETFLQWRSDGGSRMLWVRGDPGKGKTMLLCGIIEELQKQDPGCKLVYFFCQANNTNLNTANAVLRGLLYLMIKDEPDLIKDLRQTHHGRQLFEDANGWDVLCRMFTRVLTRSGSRGTTIIIDALDECIKDRDNLLEFIVKLPSTSSKIIVSSRNWPMIERGLAPASHKAAHLSLELNEHAVSAAVVTFIKHKVDQLVTTHEYDSETEDLVYNHLVEKASNTFLWAALACRQLADIHLENWNVESKLKEFPAGLDELYARMLGQVTISKANVSLFKQILAITLTVFRPVEISELKHLLGPPGARINDTRSLERAVMQCGSFLTVKDHTVYFVHQSAKDYLSEQASDTIMPHGILYEHGLLCSNSLGVMSRLLRRDMHNLKVPGASADEVEAPSTELAPLRYCCRYWIDHFCYSEPKEADQVAEVHQFCERFFLHWLEAMSLLRSVFESLRCIDGLSRKLQVIEGASQLLPLVQDASRFVQYHRKGIEDAPLQVYHSALIFSPSRSVVRGLYQHEEPGWVTIKPLVKESWSHLLQLFEPHDFPTSVTFSPDSNTLASSNRAFIKVWDTMTGRCLTTIALSGHDWYDRPPVTFSPDGKALTSVTRKTIIGLWNVGTGQSFRELQGHSQKINAINYSKNGSRLLSASADRSIKLWDPATAQCLLMFDGHQSSITSAIFSLDDRTVISASTGGALKVWNVATGRCLRTVETLFSSKQNSIVLMHDDTTLVMPCESGDIQIWDITSGECLRDLQKSYFNAADASQTSRMIASDGGGHNLIKLWDIDTCHELGVIHDTGGVTGGLLSLAFSPDGTRVATASTHDRNVKLWDIATFRQRQLAGSAIAPDTSATSGEARGSKREKQTEPEWQEITTNGGNSHFYRKIASIAISNDGQRVVSVRGGHSIVDVWDTQSGRHLQRLQVHQEGSTALLYMKSVTAVAFSRDGNIILARLEQNALEIWNVTEGSLLRNISGCGYVRFLTFSQDANFLAASSPLGLVTLQIWNINTGQCFGLSNSSTTITHMRFSESGKTLYTDVGNVGLNWSAPLRFLPEKGMDRAEPSGYHVKNAWIMEGSTRILWLPSEYRTNHFAVKRSTVALGLNSGDVVILRFA